MLMSAIFLKKFSYTINFNNNTVPKDNKFTCSQNFNFNSNELL